jgi:tetratricopeptide (TPR) repeat protein
MTNEKESNRSGRFVTSLLPWLLAAGMLLLYVLTANRWISLGTLQQVSQLNGMNWRPNLFMPLTFLVTYPFHWLPANILPLALNLFTAACAALTLALLARSVSLLPHDRTHEQRQRELSEFSFLTIRSAWLPPLLAVLVCGLQLTFWENATESTGEILDLLLFAYMIRCLLEFRINQKASWLNRLALVYGLAIANNWGMVGYLPCFLAAVVWIKGLSFFNLRFLARAFGFWLAGLSLLLLLPLVASLSDTGHMGFWPGLHAVVAAYKHIVMAFPRKMLLLLSLTSLLPIFVMGIRWASFFGDTSPLGIFLATSMFHVVHALFLVAGIWVALDSPISPRYMGAGCAFLPFYYLGALSIGYFSGYFLLIFGTKIPKARHRPHLIVQLINQCVTVLVWLLLITAPCLLIYRNLPHIRGSKNDPLRGYFTRVEQLLPAQATVILSDDPARLLYFQALSDENRRKPGDLLIDTSALAQDPVYLQFLDKKYPQFKLASLLGNHFSQILNPLVQMELMQNLSTNHAIYYLHPSFGYYFEQFYMQPHGLVYELTRYPTNSLIAPSPNREDLAENQEFWRRTAEQEFPRLVRTIKQSEQPLKPNQFERFMAKLHLKAEPDLRGIIAGLFYSRALDHWGTILQQTGAYAEAGNRFSQAKDLSPHSLAAEVNYQFNQDFRAGKHPAPRAPKEIEESFGNRRKWDQILRDDGPFDEPSFCYHLGTIFTQTGLYRQAIQQFTRVRALAPDRKDSLYSLIQLSLLAQDFSNALVMTDQILEATPDDANALLFKGMGLIQSRAYADAIPPLNRLMNLQTNNYNGQLYRAIARLQSGNLDASRQDYEAVIKVVPTAYQAYYGLAEIASRQKDTPAVIKNYQLYLTNAPPNTEEARLVTTRLKELQPVKSDQP